MIPDPPAPPARPAYRLRWYLALLLGCLGLYAWTGPGTFGRFSTPAPGGYYAHLTDAFLSGQTYLKLKPDPALKLLENPWAGNQGVPRLHDATYYHDRYYLYFSFVPALLVCAPWKLLTGGFLIDGAVTFLCAAAGLLMGAALLRSIWRRWFDSLSGCWLSTGLLWLAFGTSVANLVADNAVYPAPIAAAYACLMAALLALIRALTVERARARCLALALASLGWGLAVACRPNYLFSLAALGPAIGYLAFTSWRKSGAFDRATANLLLAGLTPAALMGACIAGYNYVRFGQVTEFGVKYMFAAGDQSTQAMLQLIYLPENLRTYFLQSPIFSPYFPFLTRIESGVGIFFAAPLTLIILAWPLTLLHRPFRRDPAWIIIGLTLGLAFLCNLLATSLVSYANERYRADFMPSLVLLSLVTLFGLLRAGQQGRGRRVGQLVFGGLLLWALLQAAQVFVVHNLPPARIPTLARWANLPTSWIERWSGVHYGPATLSIRFPRQTPGTSEPIVSSGDGRDVLYVTYLGDDRIQFGFFHLGAGGPVSEPVAIDPNRDHELTLDLGCFYPPPEHPAYAGLTEPEINLLRRRLNVFLDGAPLITTGSHFYPTYPRDIHVGNNPHTRYLPGRFSGTLGAPRRPGITQPAPSPYITKTGTLRLTLVIPPFRTFYSEPLISTGHTGAGDLLYLTYVGPGQVRFGYDSWGAGAIESVAADYVPDVPQILDVGLPSLALANESGANALSILRFNDAIIMADGRPRQPTNPAEFVLGFNGSGSSVAAMNFSGRILSVQPIEPIALPADQFQLETGPARFVLRFPQGLTGRSEPLLVSGRNGAADIIYVQYTDETHIRIGYDHWNFGGPLSDPIPLDYLTNHTVEIQLGSLYPPAGQPAWAAVPAADRAAMLGTVVVRVDGREVLRHERTAYPAAPAEIQTGVNSIGASTCETKFFGQIFSQERLGLRPLDPAAP